MKFHNHPDTVQTISKCVFQINAANFPSQLILSAFWQGVSIALKMFTAFDTVIPLLQM